MNAGRWLSILVALFPPGATAALSLSVDPADNPMVMVGWLDEPQTGGFVGNIRLTAVSSAPESAPNGNAGPAGEAPHVPSADADSKSGAKATDASGAALTLLLLPSDLKLAPADGSRPQGEVPDVVISRSNVTLSGNPRQLTLDVPTDVAIHVGGLNRPGTYRGTLKLALAGDPQDPIAVPLEVRARARPSLTPLSNANELKLDLVQCSSCWLARLVLPKSAFTDQWDLGFENTSTAQAVWGTPAVDVRGEKTGYQLTSQVSTSPKGSIPAGGIGSLPVTLKREDMTPDHYKGSLYLSIVDANVHQQVPVNLNVRSGPMLALVAIAFGVLLGQLAEYMQKRGEPQAAQLAEVERVARALRWAHSDDQALLGPQLAKVREAVYYHRLDRVTADLASIEARIAQLDRLRKLEAALLLVPTSENVQKGLEAIGEARRKIEDAEDAAAAIEEARRKVDEANRVPEGAVAFDAGAESGQAAGGRWKALAKFFAPLIDPERRRELRAWLTLHLGRPLMHVVLLLGLVAVGFNTLYLGQPTFGAQPFGDYLGLILWGLSADVARRTLTNLPGTAR